MENPMFQFEDAERVQLKASIMIEGLSGSGKSGLALLLGFYLANGIWHDVFDVDTENKSANLFAGIPFTTGNAVGKFRVGQLTEAIGYKPTNYLAYREAAVKMGAQVVIEDSISHAWQYKGGILDMVNEAAGRSSRNDKYAAWRDEAVAAEKNNLLALIRDARVHVITTVRVKEKFEYATGDDGKSKLQSLGEQQIQQADLKYEPDLVLHMERAGSGMTIPPKATVIKSRYAILETGNTYEFTPELCLQLKAYLEEGADPQALLEQQRQDYVVAISAHLDAHSGKKSIWGIMKKDAGYGETPLKDVPLDALRKLFMMLTTD